MWPQSRCPAESVRTTVSNPPAGHGASTCKIESRSRTPAGSWITPLYQFRALCRVVNSKWSHASSCNGRSSAKDGSRLCERMARAAAHSGLSLNRRRNQLRRNALPVSERGNYVRVRRARCATPSPEGDRLAVSLAMHAECPAHSATRRSGFASRTPLWLPGDHPERSRPRHGRCSVVPW